MKAIMAKIFCVCTILLFLGCGARYVPYPDKLWEIECEPYSVTENCCVHKSVKYANLLLDAGIEAYVVCGVVDQGDPHAWVIAINPETKRPHVIDPTWPDSRDGYGPTQRRVVWIQFECGITAGDVREHRKIAEIYFENIPTKYHWFYKHKLKETTGGE